MADLPRALSELVARLSPENRAALADAVGHAHEPIAVLGIGCRFPGADGPDAFWRLLAEGRDEIREVPRERFDIDAVFDADASREGRTYSRCGGFLDRIDMFDPHFFGIAPREAAPLDPQQRLLLEVSWEAMEHAGLDVLLLAGSDTGVFIGQSANDFFQLSLQQQAQDAYTVTGATAAVAAGRIAYTYDLHGPTLVVDTICSSSLVAVHLAVRSLRARECGMALAGGVNVIASPWGMIAGSRLGALSRSGRCRTFDAAADGFVRGEGCGILVLKRLSDALAAGDPVLAVIAGSAVNHDGRSNGLTAPNLAAQRALIAMALADARLQPGDIDLIEAHGTGTPLGDPIELEALRDVFGGERPRAPLYVGSVKTNIGHLEAAAGIASLIKAVLAVAHGRMPAHLHLKQLNPRVGPLPFRMPSQLEHWPGAAGPDAPARRAGVSSFGLSGTNAHVIVEQAPRIPMATSDEFNGLLVLPLSAQDDGALRALAAQYRSLLGEPGVRAADVVQSAWLRRMHHPRRAAAVGTSAETLSRGLEGIAAGEPAEGAILPPVSDAPEGDAGDETLRKHAVASAAAMAALMLRTTPGSAAVATATGPGDAESALRLTLARAYVAGVDVERSIMAPPGRFVPPPSYPWQRQRYWPSDTPHAAGRVGSAASAHAAVDGLLGERQDVAVHPELTVFEQLVSLHALPLLTQHRVQGQAVAPGAALVATLCGAAAATGVAAPLALRELRFEQFLAFEEDAGRRVQTAVEADRATLLSRGMDDERWTTHARARIGTGPAPGVLPPLDAVRARCAEEVTPAAHYARFDSLGIELGPAFRALRGVRRGSGEALAEIVLPAAVGADPFGADTVLFDACLQTLYHTAAAGEGTFVPLEVEELVLHAPLAGAPRVFCHAVLRAAGARSRTGDLQVRDETGRMLLEARGVTAWQVSERAAGAAPRTTRLFEIAWREQAPQARAGAPGSCILVGGSDASAQRIAAALGERDAAVVTLPPPRDEEDWRRAIQAALDGFGAGCRVVLLETAKPTNRERLDEAAAATCTAAVQLAQCVVDRPQAPRLYLVGHGAQAADAAHLTAGALWGVARCLAGEHAALRTKVVNLPREIDDAVVLQLAEELVSDDTEPLVVLEHGSRRVARLVPRQPRSSPPAAAAIDVRPDATYLVTGGLGGLGLAAAERLAERGARHLALVGRSAPGDEAGATIDALRSAGADVRVHAADVAVESAVRALLEEIAQSQPPLAGIVHAAGVLADAPLARHDTDRIERVFAPKATGAWWLHRLTEGAAAPWLVFFSSASAVLEAPGQAAYAAANAFLDALARHLGHRGRAALSIGWGAWADTGMASARDAGLYRGMRLSNADALALFDTLLREGGAHAVAMEFDAAAWRTRFPGYGAALIAELAPQHGGAPAAADAPADGTRAWIEAAPAVQRTERLAEFVRDEVCSVLRLELARLRPHTPFGDLGMDSIMALEISNRLAAALGIPLPPTLLFSAPTLDALVAHLATLLRLDVARNDSPEADVVEAADIAEIRQLDDATAAQQLQRELDDLERLLGDA